MPANSRLDLIQGLKGLSRKKTVQCSRLLDADLSSLFTSAQLFTYITNLLVCKNRGMPKGKYIQDYSTVSRLKYKPIPSRTVMPCLSTTLQKLCLISRRAIRVILPVNLLFNTLISNNLNMCHHYQQ